MSKILPFPAGDIRNVAQIRPTADEAFGCRGTFSQPVYVDPVYGHGDLAHRIAEARYWERYLGVKTPLAIEQIIQSWELDL